MDTMVIKPRKSRATFRFASGFSETPSNRREFLISTWALAIVQGLLSVALVVGAFQAWATLRAGFPNLGWQLRVGVPLITFAVALIVLRLCVVSVRKVLAVQRTPVDPPQRDESEPPPN
jgi:hypothetical protein